MVDTNTIGCSASRAAWLESVRNEPLANQVSTVVWHLVPVPVLAHRGVAAVAAVSHLVAEAARGREGHLLVLVQSYPALRVRLMQSSKLFVGIRHYICIAESFFQ